ncbi:hypothetical protein [Dactylosporangium salmoneum]|uniref:VWFA domain-containing protein n=1 Tax=Dactylosporangium salmoneum TaxID=53361 RepID=A0ABP5SQX1_9ACTN
MTQTHSRPISIDRRSPGCLIFCIDQSSSMMQALPGDGAAVPKAKAVANAVNQLLNLLVMRCTVDRNGPPRHYYDVAVIGYGGHGVKSLLRSRVPSRMLVSIVELAELPIRHEEIDGTLLSIWIDPQANGQTPMCEALDAAGAIAAGWAEAHRDSFPPIIFNITDGEPTDSNPPNDLEAWSGRLRQITTQHGNALLFTLHLSSEATMPVRFPAREDEVPDDKFRRMFRVSSEMPEFMRLRAGAQPGAKGLVCNGDMDSVMWGLQIGTGQQGMVQGPGGGRR